MNQSQPPEEFCVWAWADIRRDIVTIAVGGNTPGMKQRGTAICGCTDWFRPVIFKIERIDKYDQILTYLINRRFI